MTLGFFSGLGFDSGGVTKPDGGIADVVVSAATAERGVGIK